VHLVLEIPGATALALIWGVTATFFGVFRDSCGIKFSASMCMAICSSLVWTEFRPTFCGLTFTTALHCGFVYSFSLLLWERDCYVLRSGIRGIDTSSPTAGPSAAYRYRHTPRLKHFEFPKAGAELSAELPAGNFLSGLGRRYIDLYSDELRNVMPVAT
jgi:hypothetical protein